MKIPSCLANISDEELRFWLTNCYDYLEDERDEGVRAARVEQIRIISSELGRRADRLVTRRV